MSRLEPLIEALLRSQAQEMRLDVGQRIYVLRSGKRKDVGREPLQAVTLNALAAEVLKAEDLVSLARAPAQLLVRHGNEDFEVVFQQEAGQVSVRISRLTAAGDSGSAGAFAASEAATVSPTAMAMEPIDDLLHWMVAEQASDLHLSAGSPPVIRVHGEMRFAADRPPLTSRAVEQLVWPILPQRARREFEERQDADFAYEVPGLARFRVNVFRDRNGVGTVLRQIPLEIVPAERLGLSRAVLDLCFLNKGLVVVTGPTGSGKSTTLAAMIDFINKNRSDHVITIEDPVEFVHSNIRCLVNQREVGEHTQSFKNALRAALREDPDVVLVGEMRDLETVSIAIETAETGHLVFGTLHTTTAASTVDRIIDQFPAGEQEQVRTMLADALRGVIAQVLCRRLSGGRVAAMEILLVNQAVSSLIREGKTFQIPSVMQTSRGVGMTTLNDSFLALVKAKEIEPREAWLKATDKGGLLGMLKNANFPTEFH
jgi:twitching motility protein PilT